ncbi:hypothetical protein DENIS_0098 [Desulfonema ishimotonii]|uniref:Methyltransferase domain-containing protein n=1 Tax=Desulfonema ishimotonii TaxID=45657 RepID=A0A401FQG4_9BACT|nr:class I SAM-dependent methyltransferase [Desulfonema ishimotonii]GBC59162.1 hypothetical protein DENIS_0098 [Desulfonema ishimotonii]
MNFSTFFSKQARKPSGIFGLFVMSRIFDKGNAELNAFMKALLSPVEKDHILEIGFGTGKLIHDMAGVTTRGLVEGVDFSDAMVSIAQRRNRKHIASGRVKLRQGSFEEMPCDDHRFDKICTANTLYFWPNPGDTLKKILRILKPGGKFVMGFGDKAQLEQKSLSSDVFRLYSQDDVRRLLIDAGFRGGVEILSEPGTEFILNCAVAVK